MHAIDINRELRLLREHRDALQEELDDVDKDIAYWEREKQPRLIEEFAEARGG